MEVRLGDVDPGRQPAGRRQDAQLHDPTVKKAYQTYFGWLTKDKVVDPAADRLDERPGDRRVRGRQGRLLPADDVHGHSNVSGQERRQGQVRLRAACRPSRRAPPPPGGRRRGGQHPVRRQPRRRELLQEQGPGASSSSRCSPSTDIQRTTTRCSATCRRTPQAAADAEVGPGARRDHRASARSPSRTPFTGAWGDIQLALTNVVVQSIPDLSKGSVSDADLDARLADAQKTAQSALDRAK